MPEVRTPGHPLDDALERGWVLGVPRELDDAGSADSADSADGAGSAGSAESAGPAGGERLGDDEDLATLCGFYEMEGVVAANKFRMLAALHARKTRDGDLDVEWLADTVAAEVGSSVGRVSDDLTLARQLTDQLPTTLQLLADGRLDLYRVRKIAEAARCLTEDQCDRLETRIYPKATELAPRQFVRLVNRTVLTIDASAAEHRRQQARRDRRVFVEPEPHTGMGWLNAYLPGDDLTAITTRLDTLARRAMSSTTDDSTLDQRRADTLRDLLLQQHPTHPTGNHRHHTANGDVDSGHHTANGDVDSGHRGSGHHGTNGGRGGGGGVTGDSGCGCARCGGQSHGGVAATVYVTVTAETLLGLDERAGELRGYGPITAEHARELAYRIRSEWIGTLLDHQGRAVAMTGTGYRFRGKLAEFIRFRDHTCTHPGCDRPAHRCDIDHLIPWPRGSTTATNAATACRRHHRLKTLTNWTVRRHNNQIQWIDPNGKQHSKPPETIHPPPPTPPTPQSTPPNNDPPPF